MITTVYIEKKSIVHDLDFWTKFLCMLLILPLAGIIAPVKILSVIVAFMFAFLLLSKISLKTFWNMTKSYNVPITIGVVVLSLLLSEGTINQRFESGLIFAVRFIVLISFGVLFAMVTNPIEIPTGMMRAKIPHKYGVTVMVGYRMLPLISSKIRTVIDAQRARGAEIKFSIKRIHKFILSMMSLIIPILHSTLETSVKLSETLISRGYNPNGNITVPPSRFTGWDYAFIGVSIGILILVFLA
jgi:energy-coupling factor transport system permease protein